MSDQPDRFVPAAGRAAFTVAYDMVMAVTMRERLWRPVLVRELGGAADGRSCAATASSAK